MKHTYLALTVSLILGSQIASANPNGGQVVHGTASFSSPNANVLNVTNSHNAVIQWQNFNIGSGQTTNFIQPSAASSVLNRVVGSNPSQILGNLNSNGKVFLINQHGLLVGEGAHINTAGFFGSTLNITDADFLNGKLKFAGGGLGGINNQGYIHAGADGNIVLIAPNIENGGVISVENGNIILAAGQSITITNLQNSAIEYEVSSRENSITNLGQIIARQGAASLFAGSLKHSGSIRASGLVQDADGTIRLVAAGHNEVSGELDVSGEQGGKIEILGDSVEIQDGAVVNASGTSGGGEILIGGDQQGLNPEVQNATSTTIAQGAQVNADATDSGKGGKVIVFAKNDVHVHGEVTAKGGINGGDGGFIETSGLKILDITVPPDATAPLGNGGIWLIDPFDITIQDAAPPIVVDTSISVTNLGGTTIRTSDNDSAILTTDTIVTALNGGISVIVSTGAGGTQQGNITINDPINAGPSVSLVSLTFNAHNDINVNADLINTGFGYDLNLNSNSDATGGGQINFTNSNLSVGGAVSLNGPSFINGVVDFNGGTVNLGGLLTVNAGGQLLKGFGQFSGAGSIINDGTTIFSGGCGDGCTPLDMDVPFTNNSVLRLDQVFFNVNNTMTNNGLIDLVNNPFLDGSGLKIGDGLLAGDLILNPGTSITSGLGTDITIGPLGSMDVLTPTVIDPAINLTLANGTINNFHNLTIPDTFDIFGGTLSGPGTFSNSLLREVDINIDGNSPLIINDLVMQLGGANVLWQASGPGGSITLNNSSLIIEDQFDINNADPGAAISGTNSDIVLAADSFLTQFSSVNTNINVPISSARGYIQLFGFGGGLTLPGDLTIQDGGHLDGVGVLNLGGGNGTLTLASGGGVEPGLDFGIGTGTLFVNGNVRFEANSRGVFELNSLVTDGWDQLSVSGAVTIDPGSNLYVLWDNFATQSFQVSSPVDLIFASGGLTGDFTNRIDPVSVSAATVIPQATSLQYTVDTADFASVFFWDGGGDGISWSDPLNWNSGLIQNALPGTNSLVVLEAGTEISPIQLTSLEPAGGGFADIQIDGVFDIGAGGNLNVAGNLITRGDMLLLDGATISGSGTWHNLGFAELAGVNTNLTVANIENHAALVWAQLGITDSVLNVNSNLINYGSHLMFSFQTNSNNLNYTGPSGLVNHGFFAIDSGSDLLLNGTFSNLATGEFFMRGANVLLGGNTAMDGSVFISQGSQLVYQGGNHNFAATLAQSGQTVFDAGTFTGQFNLAAADSLDISAAIADVTFNAFVVDAQGSIVFSSTGNDLRLNNNSQLNINNNLALQHTSSNADFIGDTTSSLFNSVGASIDMQSVNDFNLGVNLLSDGDLNINSGAFIVQRNADLSGGDLNIAPGAQFRVDTGGSVTLGSTFGVVGGSGQMFVENTGVFDFGVASLPGKNLSTLQSLNINGGLLLNSQDVALPAIVNVSTGSIISGSGPGTLVIPSTTTVNWNGGAFSGVDSTNRLTVDNQGTIDVLAGAILNLNFADLLATGSTTTGSLSGAGSVNVNFDTSLTAASAVNVGQVNLLGGTLAADNLTYGGILNWQSGSVSGNALTTTGQVNLRTGALNADWTISPTGTVLWDGTSDDVLIISDATITNQGRFNITSFVDIVLPRPGAGLAGKNFSASTLASFINQGLLVIDSAPSTGGIDPVIFDLNFDNDGGTIAIVSGVFSLGGVDLLLDQATDTLQGFGTFEGNVINTAGIVTPGINNTATNNFQTGRLTIDGNFTQSATGSLVFDLDSVLSTGLLHDSLNVTGQLNAGGRVAFNIINNSSVFEIAALLDQSFRPLSFSTLAGRFDSVAVPPGLNFEFSDTGEVTITSSNTDLIKISNQLEELLNSNDLIYSDLVETMRFVDRKMRLALNDEDEEEERRAPRLVCK